MDTLELQEARKIYIMSLEVFGDALTALIEAQDAHVQALEKVIKDLSNDTK